MHLNFIIFFIYNIYTKLDIKNRLFARHVKNKREWK